MSTSALASARRRRATNETQVSSANISSTRGVQSSPQPQKDIPKEQNQTLTPLQILQIHDMKLKELETIVAEFTDEELLSKFIDEKLEINNELAQIKNSLTNKESNTISNGDNTFHEKLQVLEQNFNNKLEIQNNKIEEFIKSMREIFANFKEDNTKLMTHITSSIGNEATLKYESMSNKLIHALEGSNKFDTMASDMNELKLLVIKYQTIALETSNNMHKIKEQCDLNVIKTNNIDEKIISLSNKKDNSNDRENYSKMMLDSLLSGSLFNSRGVGSFDIEGEMGELGELGELGEIDDLDEIDAPDKLHIIIDILV